MLNSMETGVAVELFVFLRLTILPEHACRFERSMSLRGVD